MILLAQSLVNPLYTCQSHAKRKLTLQMLGKNPSSVAEQTTTRERASVKNVKLQSDIKFWCIVFFSILLDVRLNKFALND